MLRKSKIPDSFEISVEDEDSVQVLKLSPDSRRDDFSRNEISALSVLKNQLETLLGTRQTDEEKDEIETHFLKAVSAFSLSEREADVLRLIADGRSNGDISEQIHVSISTVKKHVYNIFNKAGVNSRTQLLNMVYGIRK